MGFIKVAEFRDLQTILKHKYLPTNKLSHKPGFYFYKNSQIARYSMANVPSLIPDPLKRFVVARLRAWFDATSYACATAGFKRNSLIIARFGSNKFAAAGIYVKLTFTFGHSN